MESSKNSVIIEDHYGNIVPISARGSFDNIMGTGIVVGSYADQNKITLENAEHTVEDYSVSTYTNVNTPLHVQYQNNLLTRVKFIPGLNKPILRDCVGEDCGDGVYIVEKYTIKGLSKHTIDDITNYYTTASGISYNDTTIASIKAAILAGVTNKKYFSETILRIVTYIDYDTLKNNQLTYISGPGLVISCGDTPVGSHHPYSPIYVESELLSTVNEPSSVNISMSIVDDDNKPYYYMLGSTVKSIRPIVDKKATLLSKGCRIVTTSGSNIIDKDYFSLEEFENKGFYKSRQMCECAGNADLILAETKFKAELDKHKLSIAKVTASNDKLVLEQSARVAAHKMDMEKRSIDTATYAANKLVEINYTYSKHIIANLQLEQSLISSYRSENAAIGADMRGIIKTDADIYKANQLYNMKVRESGIKFSDVAISMAKKYI